MTELLDSVLSQTSWGAVEDELEKRRAVLVRQMVYDNVTYEEYLRISGEIRGIDYVIKMKARRLNRV